MKKNKLDIYSLLDVIISIDKTFKNSKRGISDSINENGWTTENTSNYTFYMKSAGDNEYNVETTKVGLE
jgi:hypothetical protein